MLKRAIGLFMSAILMLAMGSEAALAGSLSPDIPEGDASIRLLIKPLFGALAGVPGGADPLIGVIFAFNAAVLTFAGILAAYTMTVGVLNTAHEGEMLGRKWSSIWIPIRTAVGAAAIFPIKGGYCAIQYAVMFLVIQGIGLADLTWKGFFDSGPFSDPAKFAATAVHRSAAEMAYRMLAVRSCQESYNRESAVIMEDPREAVSLGQMEVADGSTGEHLVIRVGGSGALFSGLSSDVCGTIILPNPDFPSREPALLPNSTEMANADHLAALKSELATRGMRQVHKDATLAMYRGLAPVARALVDPDRGVGPNERAIMDKLTADYAKAIDAATPDFIAAANNDMANISQAAAQDGWATAGSLFTRIVSTNNRLSDAINNLPTVQSGASVWSVFHADSAGNYGAIARARFEQFRAESGLAGANTGLRRLNTMDHADASDSASDFQKDLIMTLTKVDLSALSSGADTRHPLVVLTDVGDRLVQIPLEIMTLRNGLAFSLTGLITVVFFGFLFILVLIAGLGLKFVLPLLPFFSWYAALMGFMLLVAESIFAAPLWAAMHVHPEGDGVQGKAGAGYMLVLQLCMTPVLMIVGFSLAVFALDVGGKALNALYFDTVLGSARATGWTSFLWMVIATLAYLALMFATTKKMFDLVHLLPQHIMKWIGGGADSLLGSTAQHVGGSTAVILGQMRGDLSRSAGKAIEVGGGAAQKLFGSGGKGKDGPGGGNTPSGVKSSLTDMANREGTREDMSNRRSDHASKLAETGDTASARDTLLGDRADLLQARDDASMALSKAMAQGVDGSRFLGVGPKRETPEFAAAKGALGKYDALLARNDAQLEVLGASRETGLDEAERGGDQASFEDNDLARSAFAEGAATSDDPVAEAARSEASSMTATANATNDPAALGEVAGAAQARFGATKAAVRRLDGQKQELESSGKAGTPEHDATVSALASARAARQAYGDALWGKGFSGKQVNGSAAPTSGSIMARASGVSSSPAFKSAMSTTAALAQGQSPWCSRNGSVDTQGAVSALKSAASSMSLGDHAGARSHLIDAGQAYGALRSMAGSAMAESGALRAQADAISSRGEAVPATLLSSLDAAESRRAEALAGMTALMGAAGEAGLSIGAAAETAKQHDSVGTAAARESSMFDAERGAPN